MNAEKFQSNLKGKVALVDFNAPWCAPCRAQEPVIKELAEEYQGRASIIEINIDQEKKLATQYMVQSIPTLILFDNGQEIKRFVGLQTKSAIAASLDSVLDSSLD